MRRPSTREMGGDAPSHELLSQTGHLRLRAFWGFRCSAQAQGVPSGVKDFPERWSETSSLS